MPRRVKCRATGEWGTNDVFYRPEDVKFYFKDKETYEKWKLEIEENKNKVRCCITKERGSKDDFYFDEESGRYFKNKEVFDEWRAPIDKRKEINDMLADFVGYYNGEPFPTLITKKIRELESAYDIFTVYDAFIEKREEIQFAMDSREFNNTYHKCSYIIAVIINNIDEIWRRKKREEKLKARQEAELESEDADFVYIPAPVKRKNTRDISHFLEDELWN